MPAAKTDPTATGPLPKGAQPIAPEVEIKQRTETTRDHLIRLANAKHPDRFHSWVTSGALETLERRGLQVVTSGDLGVAPKDNTPVEDQNSTLAYMSREEWVARKAECEKETTDGLKDALLNKENNADAHKIKRNFDRQRRPRTLADIEDLN